MTYKAPVQDMMFVVRDVVGVDDLPQMKAAGLSADDIEPVLDSAGELAAGVLAPLSRTGDREGCRLANGAVTTPRGFKEAYKQYREGGWNGVPFSPDHGGQGLPWTVAFPIMEMWQSANTGFGLCPMLNQAAVEAIEVHGTPEQRATYLEKLVSGVWTGTMHLTEPQAGSDLGLIKTRAERQADGTYRLKGQKIYITYGEHDFTENIIHMVLARVTGAPDGTRGISMFIVPKFLPGSGVRNDVTCVSIEHKLGIHASPTCTMQFGDEGGAVGYLIGKENEGLKYMFTMMNNARLAVGLQGVAVAEAAYQHALSYARQRVQGSSLTDKSGARIAIIEHADVKRMLLSMKAQIEAGRALTYEAIKALDLARTGDKAAQARADLLTPVVKAWCTDIANDVTSTGIQIHGGMGYIEETGAAQFYRDARIMAIYEGTNGIQAMDLAFRKTIMDGGAAFGAWHDSAIGFLGKIKVVPAASSLHKSLTKALTQLRAAADSLLQNHNGNDPESVAAVSVPYLRAFGLTAGGVMMARRVLAAQSHSSRNFAAAQEATAHYYATHILPQAGAAVETVTTGGDSVKNYTSDKF